MCVLVYSIEIPKQRTGRPARSGSMTSRSRGDPEISQAQAPTTLAMLTLLQEAILCQTSVTLETSSSSNLRSTLACAAVLP